MARRVNRVRWSSYGTIEPSAEAAIAEIAAHPEWLDLSQRYFVLLGAGSAMGPIQILLAHGTTVSTNGHDAWGWQAVVGGLPAVCGVVVIGMDQAGDCCLVCAFPGANIVAVDINIPGVWNRLLKMAEDSCGTMTFPLSKPQEEAGGSDIAELAKFAGCNLFTHAPEVKNWVASVHVGKQLVIGGYAYLDAWKHVIVSTVRVGACARGCWTGASILCANVPVCGCPIASLRASVGTGQMLAAVSFRCATGVAGHVCHHARRHGRAQGHRDRVLVLPD